MAIVKTSDPILSDLVKYESHVTWKRNRSEVVYNDTTTDLKIGTVLGKETATGKYKVLNPAAVDGTENAAAVVIENVPATANTDTNVAVLGGDVPYEVVVGILENSLVFNASVTDPQKATAKQQLQALGFQLIK